MEQQKTNIPNAKNTIEKMGRLVSSGMSKADLMICNKADAYADLNFSALTLWVLKKHFGFTKAQLNEFFELVAAESKKRKDYEHALCLIPEAEELKAFGIDVEALTKGVQNSGNK